MTRKYHHGDAKNAIIRAAKSIIEEEGIGALSIRNTAERAGISHTAVYRHYRNKESLIASIAVHGFQLLSDCLDDAVMNTDDELSSRLVEAGTAYISFAMRNPLYYRLMFGDYIPNKTGHPELFSLYDSGFKKLLQIIRQDTGRTTAEITAIAAWSLLHGYASLIIDNKKDKAVGSDAQISLIMRELVKLL